MLVITEKKVGKGFMITPNNLLRGILKSTFLFLLFITLDSCDSDRVDDPIPYQPFPDHYIEISNFPALTTDGGTTEINDIGVRGVILYRKSSTVYIAFERNCSFQPNDACATVDVHTSTLFMEDACCRSSFNFDGNPTGGPAWRPLHQYRTSLSGNTLTITDEII